MMSLMDHAPGHRQYPDVKRFRERTMRTLRLSEAEADAHIDRLLPAQERVVPQHRAALAERGKARDPALATTDDAPAGQVAASADYGFTMTPARHGSVSGRDRMSTDGGI